MAFTRPWDDTFPPDTQQANLLGQDIRRDKEDTAERIRAFGAGKIANRETPEADFGNANIGALFFAEDEDKLYRWSGTAWNRVYVNHKLLDTAVNTIVGDGTEQFGSQVTIPANFLAVGDEVDIVIRVFQTLGGTGIGGVKIYFGPTIIATADLSNTIGESSGMIMRATVVVLTATTQRGGGVGASFIDKNRSWLGSPTEAISGAILLRVAATAAAGQNWTSDLMLARIRG